MTLPLTISPQAAFAAAVVVKATLVLSTAALATFALSRRAPAAARHLVWTLAVCALLALPLLALALPGWRLPFVTVAAPSAAPPAGTLIGTYVSAAPAAASTEGTPAAVYAPGAPVVATTEDATADAYAPPAPVLVVAEDVPVIALAPAAPVAPVAGVAAPVLAGTGGGGWMRFARMLALAYAAVTLALLARIVAGRLGVRRLAREAVVVTDPEWTGLVRDLAWQLEIGRPVTLLRSTRATMPMTWGVRRPTILLPAESVGWTTDRIRVVLLHELAHVARHDCLTQTLAAVACALYWFHPGSWHAARRLRVERELACDDRVLAAGTRAREYASHLLEVARAFRAPPLAAAAAVSMARPSQLEGRLLAVLDGVRDRRTVSRRAAGLAAMAAAGLVLPLAAMRPGEARAAEVSSSPPADVAPPAYAAVPGGGNCELERGTSFNCTVQARSGERLYLELSDHVSVRVVGRDHDGVAIRTGNGRRQMDVTAGRVTGGVRVRASVAHTNSGAGPDLIIEVPGRFDVQVAGDGSGVELRDVRGTFTGHTRGGGLAFIRAAGTVRMDAGGGGAYISESHLEGRLEMRGGGVMMAGNRGDLDIVGAGATVYGSPDQAREWSTRARTGERSERPGDVTWRADGDGSGRWTASVAGADVDCRGDNCVVYVDTGGAGHGSDVRGSGRAWSRAAASADARGRPVVAQTWSGTGRSADARGAPAAVAGASSDSRTQARTWASTGGGVGYVAGTPGDQPVVIGADADGFAYATGEVAGRIASIDAMARYAPVEAAAPGIARMALDDPDARVQRAAVDALAGLRGSVRNQQLRRIAREHRNPDIRRRAEAALR